MITFSLKSFDINRTKEDLFHTNRMMLDISQLRHGTDSIQKKLAYQRRLLPLQLSGYYAYLRLDTTGRGQNRRLAKWQVPLSRLAPPSAPQAEQALSRARNVSNYVASSTQSLFEVARDSAEFRIEIYKKYTQSFAVLMMFLIGAPLGAIIKKGGLGVPILISILFFIVFYVLDTMGSKYGREFVLPVGSGNAHLQFGTLRGGFVFSLPGI